MELPDAEDAIADNGAPVRLLNRRLPLENVRRGVERAMPHVDPSFVVLVEVAEELLKEELRGAPRAVLGRALR
eukprot:7361230-Lingulodinium_polyedra.AAC.1